MRATRKQLLASRAETLDQQERRLKTRLRQALNELDDQEREFQDKERTLEKLSPCPCFWQRMLQSRTVFLSSIVSNQNSKRASTGQRWS